VWGEDISIPLELLQIIYIIQHSAIACIMTFGPFCTAVYIDLPSTPQRDVSLVAYCIAQ
jgi:hypothetical protein